MKALFLFLCFGLFTWLQNCFAQEESLRSIQYNFPGTLTIDRSGYSMLPFRVQLNYDAPSLFLTTFLQEEGSARLGSDQPSVAILKNTLHPEKRQHPIRKFAYKCWLYGSFNFSCKSCKVYLQNIDDTSLTISIAKQGNSFLDTARINKTISISNIDKLKIRKKGSVGKGMLIGAATGFAVGGLLGFMGIPDYGVLDELPPGENALAGGFVFSIPGIVIGGVLGSLRVKIPINKNQDLYQRQKPVIARYAS